MRMRSILFLALLGFMATAKPLVSSQLGSTLSSTPVITTGQFPPPAECGILDICTKPKK